MTGPPELQTMMVSLMINVLPPRFVTALVWALVMVKLGGPMVGAGVGMATHWRQKRAPTEVP